jgi:acetyltransferase-like isoleucine patch superfamily enzyme
MEEREHKKIQEQLADGRKSAAAKYVELVVGRKGLGKLLKYEFINWFCQRSGGAWGLWKRKKLYPKLLASCGRGVVFGRNVVLRHPHKIRIGNEVVIDDNVLLDAKGENNRGITIADGVFVGRNSILSCKDGDIEVGERTNIGFNCEIFSAGRVVLGAKIFLAAYCYLVGGTHRFDRTDIPIMDQEREAKGIEIGDNCWLGAGVVVDDGVTIGRDAVVGAGAVVNNDVAEYSVVGGVPAKFIKDRRAADRPS